MDFILVDCNGVMNIADDIVMEQQRRNMITISTTG